MKTLPEYITLLQSYMQQNASKYGILRMGIFGSVARNEHTDVSDVDVYVEGQLHGFFALAGIKQDLEEAADPYEFLDKNYSISGILDNLDKLSPKELKCACCLFGVALQKACKKKRRW